jgi:hypothetical protein
MEPNEANMVEDLMLLIDDHGEESVTFWLSGEVVTKLHLKDVRFEDDEIKVVLT